MGDSSTNAEGDVNNVTPLTVSAYFDKTHKKYLSLVRGDEDTASKEVQAKITETIRKLEDLTRQVSVLGILSENENYKEMNPSELKFILLPFMIGNLWQLSRTEGREHICHLSKVYFRDYLKRCYNYEIITKLPPEAQPDEEEEDEEVAGEGSSNSNKARDKKKAPPKMNSDDLRAMKIQRFKEAKMLDEKINPLLNSHLNGEDLDDDDLRTFVVSLLQRSTLEAEDQLRSIAQELELIKYAEKMKIAGNTTSSASTSGNNSDPTGSHEHHHHHHHHEEGSKGPKKRPEIFILTKTQVEKQVFGAGYPAVPVMTVEELYEQRRKTGQWGPAHPSANLPPATETDDDRDAQRERLEDQDDDELIARQRRMDEYKDEHRAGWGNRYNRS